MASPGNFTTLAASGTVTFGLGATTGYYWTCANSSGDGLWAAFPSTSTFSTINLTAGATIGKVWQCTNTATGAGAWVSVASLSTSGALTIGNDTNITATLSGSSSSALFTPVAINFAWSGTLAPSRGGTGYNGSGMTLGDLLYASAPSTMTRLPGNTTATRKFLVSTGSGGAATAPFWDVIQGSDIGNIITSFTSAGFGIPAQSNSHITTSNRTAVAGINYQIALGGVYTAINTTTEIRDLDITSTHVSSSAGLTNSEGICIENNVNASLGTIDEHCGLHIHPGTNIGGTVTTAYGAHISAPGYGTTRYALWTEDITIGATTPFSLLAVDADNKVTSIAPYADGFATYVLTWTSGTTAPTWQVSTGGGGGPGSGITSATGTANQILLNGTTATQFSASTFSLATTLIAPGSIQATTVMAIATAVNSTIGLLNGFGFTGAANTYQAYSSTGTISFTSGSSSNTAAINIANTINTSGATVIIGAGINNSPTLRNTSGTFTNAYAYYSLPTVTGTTTIGTYASIYCATPTSTGTITTGYTAYFAAPPATAASSVSVWADSLQIGGTVTTTVASGAINLGSASIAASSLLATDASKNITTTTSTITPTFAGIIIGTLSGILKATAGTVSQATAGTDYEAPITAGTTLQYLRGDKSLSTFSTDVRAQISASGNLTYTTGNVTLNNTITGLTSVAATTFTGALTGNASTATALSTTGSANQFWKNGNVWAQPTQADISGLTTASSPSFTGVTISGLASGDVLAYFNTSKALAAVTLSSNLTLTTGTLALNTTITGLTSVSSTTLVGALTGNSSTATALSTAGSANQFWKNGNVWAQPTQADISGLTTSSSPSFTGVTISGATADTLTYFNTSKALTSVTLNSNLTLTTGTLALSSTITGLTSVSSTTFVGALTGNASTATALSTSGTTNQFWKNGNVWAQPTQADISGLTTASSPTFTGITVSGVTGDTLTYFNTSKALSSVTLNSNLTLTTGTLDTVQGIQTTSNPQFNSLGIGTAASGTAGTIYANVGLGVGVSPPTTAGYARINSILAVGVAPAANNILMVGGSVTATAVSFTANSINASVTGQASAISPTLYGSNYTGTYTFGATSTTSGTLTSININQTQNSVTGPTTVNMYGININNTQAAVSGPTTTSAYGLSVTPNTTAATGTLNFYASVFSAAGSMTGTITAAYGGYFNTPAGGTNKTALYATDCAIGVTATSPPTNGLLVSGPIKNTNLTANTLTYADASQQLAVVTLNSNLTLTTGTLALNTTITGLTSVSSTSFTGALTGNASTATSLSTSGTTNQFWKNGNTWAQPTQADISGLTTSSSPSFTGVTVSGLASGDVLAYFNTSKALAAVTLNSNLTLTTGTLALNATITGLTSVSSTSFTGALTGNASTATALSTAGSANQFWKNGNVWAQPTQADISGLTTSSSPSFTGVTVSGSTGDTLTYFNTSKALSSVTLSSNLTLTTGTLDTVQGIQTTSNPQFNSLGIGVAAPGTAGYARVNVRLGVAMAPSYPLDVTGQTRLSSSLSVNNATPNNYTILDVNTGFTAGAVSNSYGLNMSGTLIGGVSATVGNIYGINISSTLKLPSAAAGGSECATIKLTPTTDANTFTITNSYGILVAAGTNTSGTVTTAYGGYFAAPGFGTTKIALWTNDLTLGTATDYAPLIADNNKNLVSVTTGMSNSGWVLTSNGTGAAPTWQAVVGGGGGVPSVTGTTDQIMINGGYTSVTSGATFSLPTALIAPGSLQLTTTLGIQTAAPTNSGLYNAFAYSGTGGTSKSIENIGGSLSFISTTTGYGAALLINSTISSTSTAAVTVMAGIYNIPTITANSSSNSTIYGIYNKTSLTNTQATTDFYSSYNNAAITLTANLTNYYGCYVAGDIPSGAATLANMYGVYVDTLTKTTGTVTIAYGSYTKVPTAGTTNIATYTDNLSVGTAGTLPPTNGLFVSGPIKNTNLTANTLTYADASQQLAVVTLNSNLTLTTGTLALNTTISGLTSVAATTFTGALTGNASTATALSTAGSANQFWKNGNVWAQPTQADISGLTTASSPSFTGVTISGLASGDVLAYFNTSKALAAVTLNSNLTLTTGTLALNTTITGLTSVSSTTFVGTLSGNASTATALSTAGAANQFWKNGNVWAQPTQADISGLTTASSPSFTGTTISGATGDTLTYFNTSKALTSVTLNSNLTLTTGTLALNTTITGLTSVSSTTFVGALTGNSSTATALSTAGSANQFWKNGNVWAQPTQADISGLTTSSSPSFTGVTVSGLASGDVLAYFNTSKALAAVTLNSNLTLTTGTLALNTTISGLTSVSSTTFVGALTGNASTATALSTAGSANQFWKNGNTWAQPTQADISGLTTSSSPSFTGVTVSGATGDTLTYFNTSKALSSVTLSSNLTLTTGTLDTVQGIQTTSNPQFNSLGIGVAASGTAGYARINARLGIAMAPSYPLDVTGQARLSSSLSVNNATPNTYTALDVNTGFTASGASSNNYGLNISGTFIGTVFTGTSNIYGINVSSVLKLPSSATSESASIKITPQFDANTFTIAAAYGIYIATGTNATGTVTVAYGSYTKVPTAGSTNIASYTDNLAIGTTGTAPPSNGLLVSGIIKNTNLSANTLTYSDGSSQLASVTLNSNLTLTTGTLALNTTISGLTSVSSTTFVGALTGNASTATALSTAGSANQFWKNGNVWAQPTQADISGLTTSSSPSFTGVTVSGLASGDVLAYFNTSKALAAVTLNSNLTLTTGTLALNTTISGLTSVSSTTFVGALTGNSSTATALSTAGSANQFWKNGNVWAQPTQADISGLTTSSSPSFTGVTVSGATGDRLTYFNTSKALTSATLSSNLTLTTGTLDTVQGIQTTSNPQFNSLGIGTAAPGTAGYAQINANVGIAAAPVSTVGLLNSMSFNGSATGPYYGLQLNNSFTFSGGSIAQTALIFLDGTNPNFKTQLGGVTGVAAGIINNVNINPATTGTMQYAYAYYSLPTFTCQVPTTTVASIYIDTPNVINGSSITNGYGIYHTTPGTALTNWGYYQTGTFTRADDVGFQLSNTFSPTAGGTLHSIQNNPSITITTGTFTISNMYINRINPTTTITSNSVITLANLYGLSINPTSITMNTAAHVIQNYYGIRSESPAASLSGGANIQTAYSGYFAAPGFGTTKIALWTNDIRIGTLTDYAPLMADATTKNVSSITTGMNNAGWVLTSNGSSAAPTWQAAPGGGSGVPSVTGTANQIFINGGTTAVTTAATFTIPSTFIAPGSIQATTNLGVGTAISADYKIKTDITYTGAIPFYTGGNYIGGTMTFNSGTPDTVAGLYNEPTFDFQSGVGSSWNTCGIYNAPWFKSNSVSSNRWYGISNSPFLTNNIASDYYYGYYGDTVVNLAADITTLYGMQINTRITAGSGTVTTVYGLNVNLTSKASGTVTTAYGAYISNPTAGTTNIALYSDNLNLNYTGVAPPTGGMIMSGKLGIGNNNPTNQLEVTGTARFSSSVICGTGALTTTATDGFIYIPTCAGAPTGVPTTQTGTCAMAYDTTNNDLYIYDGAWQKATLNASDVSFESINNNEACYPYSLTYDGSNRYNTITYTAPGGSIVKTFSYNGDGTINTIVLSGAGLPTIAYTTKTFTYTSGSLTSVAYS